MSFFARSINIFEKFTHLKCTFTKVRPWAYIFFNFLFRFYVQTIYTLTAQQFLFCQVIFRISFPSPRSKPLSDFFHITLFTYVFIKTRTIGLYVYPLSLLEDQLSRREGLGCPSRRRPIWQTGSSSRTGQNQDRLGKM